MAIFIEEHFALDQAPKTLFYFRLNQFYALALEKKKEFHPYRLRCGESRSRFLDVTAVSPLI